MAITEAYSGSATLSTTEFSMPFNANYAAGTNKSEAGIYQLWLDLNALVAADNVVVKIYEKVKSGGTQRSVLWTYSFGPQGPPIWVSASFSLLNGWDMTILADNGTPAVAWSIRKADA